MTESSSGINYKTTHVCGEQEEEDALNQELLPILVHSIQPRCRDSILSKLHIDVAHTVPLYVAHAVASVACQSSDEISQLEQSRSVSIFPTILSSSCITVFRRANARQSARTVDLEYVKRALEYV